MLDMMMVALIGFSGVVNACAASDSYFQRELAEMRLRNGREQRFEKLYIPLEQSFRYCAL